MEEDNNGWKVSTKKKSFSKRHITTNHNTCNTNKFDASFHNTFSILQDNDKQDKEIEQVNDLYGNNKITVNIAGLQTECLIDSGSTISLISSDLLNRISKDTQVTINNVHRNCLLADGTSILLDSSVTLPIKLKFVTFNATVFVLKIPHLQMILGTDLLKFLNARIDYGTSKFITRIIPDRTEKLSCITSLMLSQPKIANTNYVCNKLPEACNVKRHPHISSSSTAPPLLHNTAPSHTTAYTPAKHNISPSMNVQYDKSECTSEITGNENLNNIVLKDRIKDIDLSNSDITHSQKSQLIKMLNNHTLAFANNLKELGRTDLMTYDIELKADVKPVRIKSYTCPWKHREIINEKIQELLEADLIEPALHPTWSTPVMLVKKPRSDKLRLVQDVRRINIQTKDLSYPQLDIKALLADIGSQNSKYFSIIDMKSAYNQVKLSDKSKMVACMSTPAGDFQPKTAIFGLKNLPHFFTKLTDLIFQDLRGKYLAYYQDDLLIYSNNVEDHLIHIEEVIKRIERANLTADPKKTHLFKDKVEFLGYTLTRQGIDTVTHNIAKIKNFDAFKSKRDCKSFLGIINYYRKHIKNFARISKPILDLTRKDITKFKWNKEAQEAVDTLKTLVTTAPILSYPIINSKHPLILTTDASSIGCAYELSQKQYSDITNKYIERSICFGGTTLKDNQKKWSSCEMELFGLTYAIKKLDVYLRGIKFIVRTDHKSLLYLKNRPIDQLKPSMARKVIFLMQYDFIIEHVSGLSIPHVDGLSRYQYPPNDSQNDNSDIDEILAIKDDNNISLEDINIDDLTVDNIKKAQKQDSFCISLYDYIKHDILPNDSKLAKRIINIHNEYVVHNGLLIHIWSNKNNTVLHNQIYVPAKFREKILQYYHDTKYAAHQGAFKVYQHMLPKFYWMGCFSDIQNYIKSCKICITHNADSKFNIPLKSLKTYNSPFESIHIDIMYLKTKSSGYQYILTILDAFTHYVIIQPIQTKSPVKISQIIFNEWFMKFGIPSQIISPKHNTHIVSDNGKELTTSWIKALYNLANVKMITTSYYKPNSNGNLELYNKTILRILRKFTSNDPTTWSKFIPLVQYVINASVSETTKYTPFELLFGVKQRQAIDLVIPPIQENISKTGKQAHAYFLDKLSKIRSLAKDNIIKAKATQKQQFDKKARPHNLKVNDLVYIKIHKRKQNDDTKLKISYKGPYVIKSFPSYTNVELVDSKNKTLDRFIPVTDLKKSTVRKKQVNNTSSESNEQLSNSDNTTDSSIPHRHIIHSQTDTSHHSSDTLIDSDSEPCHSDKSQAQQLNYDEHESHASTDDYFSTESPNNSDHTTKLDKNTDNSSTEINNSANNTDVEEKMHEIKRVLRKKVSNDGSVYYYINWKHYPSKKYNS